MRGLAVVVPTQQDEAPFYSELLEVLQECNSRRTYEDRVSFRRAVVEGMGLRDSFTSKIKAGIYKPTLDRLLRLAKFLEVHPARFDSYVFRYAQCMISEDEKVHKLFSILAAQTPRIADLLLQGLIRHAEQLLREASPKVRPLK